MQKILFFSLILVYSFCGFAQETNPEIDSLLNLVKTQKADTVKVNTLVILGNNLLAVEDFDKAIYYGNQAKDLAKKTSFYKGLGYSQKLLGLAYSSKGDYIEANLQFQEALKNFESINFKKGIANILDNMGSLSYTMADDSKSVDYHLQALRIAEEINDKVRTGTALNNIGTVYSNKETTRSMALSYYLRALAIFEEIKYSAGIATASVNIGEDYYRKKNYDSALYYFKTSADIFKGTTDAAYALTYLGDIYAGRSDFETALTFHNEAVEITSKLGAKMELAQSLLGLAQTQQKQRQYNDALNTSLNALSISREIGARQEVSRAYELLSQLYAKLNDFKNAYHYRELLTNIKDTLYNVDEGRKIQQLVSKFEIDEKESKIKLKDAEIQLQGATIERQKTINIAAGISGFLLLLLAVGSYQRYKFVRKTNKIIKDERDRSKELLLNILPEETAQELETKGSAQPRYYENATVLFTDFKGFSTIAGKLSPQELVAELNDYFVAFDEIMGKFNLEKIKTIGDAYMCAGGIPTPNETHALDAVRAGIAMQEFMMRKNLERRAQGLEGWELRIGVHTGPIVAGVVGKKKYAYDIWGDTVNIASRMESNGEPGKVNISDSTYQRIKDKYQCLYRGKISAKNIGEVDMYFIDAEIAIPAVTHQMHA